jgi:hypothetical protein
VTLPSCPAFSARARTELREAIDGLDLDPVAAVAQLRCSRREQLLVEIREQDGLAEALPAGNRHADPAGADHHDHVACHVDLSFDSPGRAERRAPARTGWWKT